MMPKRQWVVAVWSLLGAACNKDPRLGPLLPPCTASGDSVNLAVAAYVAVDPGADSGCIVFPANASGAPIEYLLVPQAANGVPDASSSFLLVGTALAAVPPAAAPSVVAPPLPAQLQFDLALRRTEYDLARRLAVPAAPAQRAPVVTAINPGDRRMFKVCGDSLCTTHPTVVAFAKTVGLHVVVFQDSVDQKAGDTLKTADLDTLAAVFDTLLYPRDTSAFGRESDVDGNGKVLVLMTGKVNSLVPKGCPAGFIAGYFYGGDLIQGFSGGNYAEIFYSLVPDPSGALSCPHSASGVKHTVPGTFIHEFQHMISWGHHVLNGNGAPEDLWLNEGLSHYAEEMGARIFTPGDSTTFCYFMFGDLYNSYLYLSSPQSYFLVDTAGIGGLANRGAYWLFVRFVVDQFSSDTFTASNDAVTRALDMTSLTGAANVANATGTPFATVVEHWALANYVSDLPGLMPPSELQYMKWRFRADYPAIHNRCLAVSGSFPSAYPLFPITGTGSGTDLSGTLRGGSGTYYIAQHAAGAPGFTLLFSDGSGRALRSSLLPRLNVIRIQ